MIVGIQYPWKLFHVSFQGIPGEPLKVLPVDNLPRISYRSLRRHEDIHMPPSLDTNGEPNLEKRTLTKRSDFGPSSFQNRFQVLTLKCMIVPGSLGNI